MCNTLGEPARHRDEHKSEVPFRFGHAGLDSQRSLKLSCGLRRTGGILPQRVPEVIVRIGVVGPKRNGQTKVGNRLGPQAHPVQVNAQVVVRHPAGGILGQGVRIERGNVPVEAALPPGERKERRQHKGGKDARGARDKGSRHAPYPLLSPIRQGCGASARYGYDP